MGQSFDLCLSCCCSQSCRIMLAATLSICAFCPSSRRAASVLSRSSQNDTGKPQDSPKAVQIHGHFAHGVFFAVHVFGKTNNQSPRSPHFDLFGGALQLLCSPPVIVVNGLAWPVNKLPMATPVFFVADIKAEDDHRIRESLINHERLSCGENLHVQIESDLSSVSGKIGQVR